MVMKEMNKTMAEISNYEYLAHSQIRDLVKTKFEPFTNKRIPDLQKQAGKLSTYAADHEISLSKVEAAKTSGTVKFRVGTTRSQNKFFIFYITLCTKVN